jgi:hypothetical protein
VRGGATVEVVAARVCVEEMRWGSRARAPVYIRRRQPRAWHAWHRLEVRR